MTPLFAVIVAGGRGTRMGQALPKQFIPLDSKPVLMHTLERFHQFNPEIKLILVLPADQITYWKNLCKSHHFKLAHQLAKGGETRFQSVKNGLAMVNSGLVAIHDGVRPFVSMATIARCYEEAANSGSAIPVTPLIESLRLLHGNHESRSLPRDQYRSVQTPQVFNATIVKRAYSRPYSTAFTDDASVVEAAGHEITLVEGNRENIKITSPFDLMIAETIMKHNKTNPEASCR